MSLVLWDLSHMAPAVDAVSGRDTRVPAPRAAAGWGVGSPGTLLCTCAAGPFLGAGPLPPAAGAPLDLVTPPRWQSNYPAAFHVIPIWGGSKNEDTLR